MGSIIKWFEDEEDSGFIEYEDDDVYIYLSTADGKTIELKLTKTEKGYKLVSINV